MEDQLPVDDRISELPQPILQHILSLLSQTEAVRTCVLSKPWRHIWCTRPNIGLDEEQFNGNGEMFRSVLDKTLLAYRDRKLSIKDFRVTVLGSESAFPILDRWIPVVVLNMDVEKFYLYNMRNPTPYDLPSIVFESKSLQELCLHDCKLVPPSKVLCKNLTTLKFRFVHIEEETLQTIISSCPLIEEMTLCYCGGFRTIKIYKKLHNLKKFHFMDDGADVEIHLPSTLVTVSIYNANWVHDTKFTNLKCLDLHWMLLSSKFFDDFSCNFPVVESLSLQHCWGFKEFQLSSRSIKHLTVWNEGVDAIKAVNIDAPNIVSFDFGGGYPPSISFAATSSSKWKSKLGLKVALADDVDEWLLKLREVILPLSQSEISLDVFLESPSDRVGLVNNGGGDDFYKPLVVENLTLGRGYSSRSLSPFAASFLLNGLFRICRPRFIGNDGIYYCWYPSRGENEFVEFLCNIPQPYQHNQELGQQQDLLEEVCIEVKNGKEWCPVGGTTSLLESAFPTIEDLLRIRFRLKWTELQDRVMYNQKNESSAEVFN